MKESMPEISRDTARDSFTISSPDTVFESEEGFRSNDKDSLPNLSMSQSKCPDEKLGFIMCECGLEGISLKVPRTQNSASSPKYLLVII